MTEIDINDVEITVSVGREFQHDDVLRNQRI